MVTSCLSNCYLELIKAQILTCPVSPLLSSLCPDYGAQATQCLPFPPSHPQQHHPQPRPSHSPPASRPLGGCADRGPSGRRSSSECKGSDPVCGPDEGLISSDGTALTKHKDTVTAHPVRGTQTWLQLHRLTVIPTNSMLIIFSKTCFFIKMPKRIDFHIFFS